MLVQDKNDSSGSFIAITPVHWVEIRRRDRRLQKTSGMWILTSATFI